MNRKADPCQIRLGKEKKKIRGDSGGMTVTGED